MTYELAKQLKDAGFPQLDRANYLLPEELKEGDVVPEIAAYAPTLSELIEACGMKFHSLIRVHIGWDASEWKEPFEGGDFPLRVNGSTPEEAVAKLWLALNKK